MRPCIHFLSPTSAVKTKQRWWYCSGKLENKVNSIRYCHSNSFSSGTIVLLSILFCLFVSPSIARSLAAYHGHAWRTFNTITIYLFVTDKDISQDIAKRVRGPRVFVTHTVDELSACPPNSHSVDSLLNGRTLRSVACLLQQRCHALMSRYASE